MAYSTILQCYIYACPEDQRAAAAEVLSDLDIGWEPGSGETGSPAGPPALSLTEPYTDHAASCGTADDLAAELTRAAPGASFVLWEDPAYSWLGSLQAYTPALGAFSADCDADGNVVFTIGEVTHVLRENAGDADHNVNAMRNAMGVPWTDDWQAACSASAPRRTRACRTLKSG
jgi:hypothetical protein